MGIETIPLASGIIDILRDNGITTLEQLYELYFEKQKELLSLPGIEPFMLQRIETAIIYHNKYHRYNIQLSPCPFCGGAVGITESNDYEPAFGVLHYCEQGRKLHIEVKWFENIEDVITTWNSRCG